MQSQAPREPRHGGAGCSSSRGWASRRVACMSGGRQCCDEHPPHMGRPLRANASLVKHMLLFVSPTYQARQALSLFTRSSSPNRLHLTCPPSYNSRVLPPTAPQDAGGTPCISAAGRRRSCPADRLHLRPQVPSRCHALTPAFRWFLSFAFEQTHPALLPCPAVKIPALCSRVRDWLLAVAVLQCRGLGGSWT